MRVLDPSDRDVKCRCRISSVFSRKPPEDVDLEVVRLVGRRVSNGNILLQTGRIMTCDQYLKLRRKVGAYAK